MNPVSVVTFNKQWTLQFQTFNGVEMALVPSGCFVMGSANGDSNEQPVTKICFDKPFWIDRTEVTQGQFKALAGKAANPPAFVGDNRPVENVTWFEARDYCASRGARLPTEAEWEYAARGPDALIYPWGNAFRRTNVVYWTSSDQQTAEVGSRPEGASWVGALDMSGNVEEWTNSIYRPYPYDANDGRERDSDASVVRVLRGGSWNNPFDSGNLRTAYRGRDFASVSYFVDGFRCAHSYD
jgi:formylglycine-generating enzyme required for sulfatase activity